MGSAISRNSLMLQFKVDGLLINLISKLCLCRWQETKRRPLATKLTAKAVLAAAATDTAGCHRDSVQSLASVKLNQRLLISSSRDGAIKVWK